MKRNKVIAMLLTSVMLLSQPASLYAEDMPKPNASEEMFKDNVESASSESTTEQNDTENDTKEENNIPSQEQKTDGISDLKVDDGSDDLKQDNEGTQENDSVDMFSDGEDSDEAPNAENESKISFLQWQGKINDIGEENITVNVSYEDGSEMGSSDKLDIEDQVKDEEKENIKQKISSQKINTNVEIVSSFNIKHTGDSSSEDKGNQSSYRIIFEGEDLSVLKAARLYHQREDGEMEELTFTSSNAENGRQQIEFVSSDGLGYFTFADIETATSSEINKSSQDVSEPVIQEEENDIELNDDTEEAVQDDSTAKNDEPDEVSSENASENGVVPIDISEFNVSFVSGAENVNGKNIWNPTDSVSGHAFIYRVNYTMSGTFSTEEGAFKIEVPLHILKDKNGNWADTFSCPYWMRSEIAENDNPDFVYEIDEKDNKVTIYNYKPYPTGEAGYVEFSYETTKDTTSYMDMRSSTKVNAKIYATNEASTVTDEAEADEVYIDTHAIIAYTQKKKPTLYKEWDDSWGEKPDDADDYYYLIWPIRSYVNKNTSAYSFYLNDNVTKDLKSEVVGYRFSGQSQFSNADHVDNVSTYGDRYDYVLTKYSKKEADDKIKNKERFYIHNNIEATVSPSDHIDANTCATSSYDWFYEAPTYVGKQGSFWAEKYGIYGDNATVESSEDISNYNLGEFEDGDEDTLGHFKYHAICDGLPYSYTIADEAEDTSDAAVNGLFWKKKIDYELTDDGIYIEKTKLEDGDYDISQSELRPVVKEAEFDETAYTFKSKKKTSGFSKEDDITVYVRKGAEWHKAAVYNLENKAYGDVDETYVSKAENLVLKFNPGIKAVRYKCSHAYFYTELNIYPEIKIYRTEHVQQILTDKPEKIAVSNEIHAVVSQDDKIFLDRQTKGTDYAQKVTRESEIEKNIIKTENIKQESRFEATWEINFREKYTDGNGIHYVYQDGGKFYDLLPAGCDFNADSLIVKESRNVMIEGEYEYRLDENYRGSGRTLLTISISTPTKNEYTVQYTTSHDYNSINDYGRSILNSVVYESGNDKIGEGYPDNGGNITDKDILKDIDKNTDNEKFVYAEARYEINFPVAAVTGLKKQIKSIRDKTYSYDATVYKNEEYSYKIRMTNDSTTKAKNIIFFDSLENFFQDAGQKNPTIESDWNGILLCVDASQMVYKGAMPTVYLSKIKDINPNEHHDLSEKTADGEAVWIEYEKFEQQYGLDKATAIAVDSSKCEDGSDFLLNEKDSVSFVIYMKAPSRDDNEKQDPVACNNIFVSRTAIKEIGDEVTEIQQFYHQDYTQAHYRISGNAEFRKVDATDNTSPISGATYRLTGTSDYGTFYDEERTSDKNGNLTFSEIEKGSYQLKETSCSNDWQLNKNTYNVIIDNEGNIKIEGLETDKNGVYLLVDDPRYHADISLQKTDCVTGDVVEGAVFMLTGISEYGNEYTLYSKSNKTGRVSFKDIELGKYELKEVESPKGYIKSNTVYVVSIDESGTATIYDSNNELKKDAKNHYNIENEPYHSVRFLKSSTYGKDIYLEGAEFNLAGISDYGTSVNMTSVSGSADDGGLVEFDGLEPGTYTLKETKAPDGYYLSEKLYTVVVNKDGTFIIDGLGKTDFGASKE